MLVLLSQAFAFVFNPFSQLKNLKKNMISSYYLFENKKVAIGELPFLSDSWKFAFIYIQPSLFRLLSNSQLMKIPEMTSYDEVLMDNTCSSWVKGYLILLVLKTFALNINVNSIHSPN